jgi:hypothetical protein
MCRAETDLSFLRDGDRGRAMSIDRRCPRSIAADAPRPFALAQIVPAMQPSEAPPQGLVSPRVSLAHLTD